MVVSSIGMTFAAIMRFSSGVELSVRHSSDLASEMALSMFTSVERCALPRSRSCESGEPPVSCADESDPRLGTKGRASAENCLEGAASTGACCFELWPPLIAVAAPDGFVTNSTAGFSSGEVGVSVVFEVVATEP